MSSTFAAKRMSRDASYNHPIRPLVRRIQGNFWASVIVWVGKILQVPRATCAPSPRKKGPLCLNEIWEIIYPPSPRGQMYAILWDG